MSAGISERDLAAYVRDVARALGWRRYHTWLSKHSPSGRGRLTTEQEEWLELLGAVPGVEVHVWRPGDMDEIARVLR